MLRASQSKEGRIVAAVLGPVTELSTRERGRSSIRSTREDATRSHLIMLYNQQQHRRPLSFFTRVLKPPPQRHPLASVPPRSLARLDLLFHRDLLARRNERCLAPLLAPNQFSLDPNEGTSVSMAMGEPH